MPSGCKYINKYKDSLTFLDFGDETPHSVARLASALDEKKESRTGATRRGGEDGEEEEQVSQAYPNPFNPSVGVDINLTQESYVSAMVSCTNLSKSQY